MQFTFNALVDQVVTAGGEVTIKKHPDGKLFNIRIHPKSPIIEAVNAYGETLEAAKENAVGLYAESLGRAARNEEPAS